MKYVTDFTAFVAGIIAGLIFVAFAAYTKPANAYDSNTPTSAYTKYLLEKDNMLPLVKDVLSKKLATYPKGTMYVHQVGKHIYIVRCVNERRIKGCI